MKCSVRSLWKNVDGAVAPTIALSLTALIAAGGLAFDYARMASMDTELQSAADQAALAAATQLDGQTDACSRAANAARSMLVNRTYMANDSNSTQITIPLETSCDATGNVRFYQDIAKTNPATSGSNATFVEVTVDSRKAYFALTPIVGAFSSGALSATAFAGLDSAICKTPPVMICNPQETGSSTTFDPNALTGVGLKLTSVGNGNGTWAPGNFGYLDTHSGVNGAPGLREALGWETAPGDCIAATGVNTEPGAAVTVTDALNTRFDIYASNVSCPNGGNCGASINSVKDATRNANSGNSCGWVNNANQAGWHQPAVAYGWGSIPSSVTALTSYPAGLVMGHPPDICHAVPTGVAGACTGPIGNGVWDRDAYFKADYNWTSAQWKANTGLSATATRYQVYKWEIAHRGQSIGGVTVLGSNPSGATGSTPVAYGTPVCSPLQGYGNGVVPSSSTPDRRMLSAAVVNCLANNVKGSSTDIPVQDWIDVFLVQPALDRGSGGSQVTNSGNIYVEVIGRTQNASNGGAVQLVKKSVPYLIE